jgi:hypothetical protein
MVESTLHRSSSEPQLAWALVAVTSFMSHAVTVVYSDTPTPSASTVCTVLVPVALATVRSKIGLWSKRIGLSLPIVSVAAMERTLTGLAQLVPATQR